MAVERDHIPLLGKEDGPRVSTIITSQGIQHQTRQWLKGPPNQTIYSLEDAEEKLYRGLQGPESEAFKGAGGRSSLHYIDEGLVSTPLNEARYFD